MKAEWTWNACNQGLLHKKKSVIKEDACMKFCGEMKPLYLETYTFGVGFRAGLQQTRDDMSCCRYEVPDKSMHRPISFANSACQQQKRDIVTQRGILYGLEKFHH